MHCISCGDLSGLCGHDRKIGRMKFIVEKRTGATPRVVEVRLRQIGDNSVAIDLVSSIGVGSTLMVLSDAGIKRSAFTDRSVIATDDTGRVAILE